MAQIVNHTERLAIKTKKQGQNEVCRYVLFNKHTINIHFCVQNSISSLSLPFTVVNGIGHGRCRQADWWHCKMRSYEIGLERISFRSYQRSILK